MSEKNGHNKDWRSITKRGTNSCIGFNGCADYSFTYILKLKSFTTVHCAA